MEHQQSRRRDVVFLAAVLVAGTAYAIARYVLLGTTAPTNIPVYVVNKAIAIASAAGLLLAGLCRFREQAESKAFWLRATGWAALLHVLLALSIMNRAYYGKFFDGEKLSLSGELAVLLGVLTAGACVAWLRGSANGAGRLWGVLTSLLLAGHLLAMGLSGWLAPAKWPGGMPPITMICFAVAAAAAVLWSMPPRQAAQR